ncbi:hypothetical protein P175DRAFT_0532036 [Aspergillus ochraceoroseus IBT 24754]|uniref:Uncharacterized protein n=1 Tax=Aspergillus ochraceoroseus IBT 24754 TaxID=1392256 RepID=A0A2T5LWM6_9EURO|nr:uncharacterized protein P175DRAFT_0532036 [Aspergillus ochraceoroseus IBT 24754]PTU20692.1 hypothetical protein P175DRAFT_0532036 [Aspergillus ochraceoroseus IBT 24754]
MTPTRSVSSRRKRDLTLQTVDFLNSVMDKRSAVSENRRVQSARPSRRLRSITNLPRNRDNCAVFDSAKARQVATTQPVTPRRSSRLQNGLQVQSSPIRRSRRLRRLDSGEPEHRARESLEVISGQEHGEVVEDSGHRSDEGNEEDDWVGVNLFSDDTPTSSHSPNLIFPSPSGFYSDPQRRRRRAQIRSDGASQSETTPNKGTATEQTTQNSVRKKESNENVSDAQGSPLTPRVPSASVVVYMNQNRRTPSPDMTRATTTTRSVQSDHDRDVEMAEVHDSATSEAEGDSVYETGDEFAYSSSLGCSPSIPASSPVAQSEEPKRSTPRGSEAFGSPPMSLEALPARSTQGRARARTTSLPTHDRPDPAADNLGEEAHSEDGDIPLLQEALQLGQQRPHWDILDHEARTLGQDTSSSISDELQDIDSLISHLRQLYIRLCYRLYASLRPSTEETRECGRLLECIFREGDGYLDMVYYTAIREKGTAQRTSPKLTGEFEARVLPHMVKLIHACFAASYIDSKHFPQAYNHLHRAMTILLGFCNRIISLIKVRYVPGASRCDNLCKAVQKLLEACKSDLLRRQHSVPEKRDPKSHPPLYAGSTEWTDNEAHALLTGLQRHRGHDKYIQILRDFEEELNGRTIRELRQQTQYIHDQFVPMIRDQLRTREGRQKWDWLLSV